jgi:hypothetical protein
MSADVVSPSFEPKHKIDRAHDDTVGAHERNGGQMLGEQMARNF